MTNYTCPQCGYPLNGTENQCPECGMVFPSNFQYSAGMQNAEFEYDEGDNDAEIILRNVVNSLKNLILIFSIIGGVISIIIGGVMIDQIGGAGIAPIIGGIFAIILGVFFARLVWAFGMIFINVSTNVRNIKHILKKYYGINRM